MKKNYLLLLVFLLLGAGTAWYLITKDKGQSSTLGWDRNFRVAENDIHKIFLAKRSGETTVFERKGNYWEVNGQSRASANAVENLLEAVTKVELLFVPPKNSTDGIAREMAARGIKVEVYGKSGDKLKTYYVGGVTPDARGTYMLMEGSEQPMAVGIPNMEGQIRTRYDLVGDDWRDKTVFGYEYDDIQAVSVEYPLQRNKSFRLKKSGGNFEVEPFFENTPAINRPLDKSNAEAYLLNFKSLMAESFENNYAKKDSIRQVIPFSVVTVTDKRGNDRKAAFYQASAVNIEDPNTGATTKVVVERYFADLNTGDFMLVQDRVFKQIFWAYEAFFMPGNKVKD
jgi:hypothetical protein